MTTRNGLRVVLEDEIGAGAFGRVVRARVVEAWRELGAGERVAVKMLHAHLERDAAAQRSLAAEIEAGARVRHAALVRHYDSGFDGARAFFAMELVEGDTLRELLERNGAVPEPQLRSIAAQCADALAALHEAGFVHADVKPENVRMTPQGRVVLMDLGFARRIEDADAPRTADRRVDAVAPDGHAMPAPELAAAEGVNPGSLAYLSPERARGLPSSPASDVFALGLVVYELATAWHPFVDGIEELGPSFSASGFSSSRPLRRSLDDPGADQLLAALVTARFVPPSRVTPGLSPFLDTLLHELLRREPDHRPTAEEARRRFHEGELGEWWRSQLDFSSSARRATRGEQDAAHLTPLVGRDRELDGLLNACEQSFLEADDHASEPNGGRAVWLLGPSGSGKSRLTSECALRARRRFSPPPLYLYGRCTSFEDQRPCMPILRWLERYLRLPTGVAPDVHQRIVLGQLVPPRDAATLLNALDPNFSGTTASAVPEALAAWLTALGKLQPLLLFLDDVNFADEGTLAVLARFATELPTTRALLVLGQRDESEVAAPRALDSLRERLDLLRPAQRIELPPLDEEAVEQFVSTLFHHTAPRRRIATVLHARSHGNPGLLGEILRLAIERGDAHAWSRTDPKLILDVAPEKLPLAESFQTSISERIAKLAPEDRDWLQRLAVVGGRLEVGFLARAFGDASESEVERVLAHLSQRGWLAAIGDRYRFARPALRESLYRSLAPERRRELHALAADALLSGGAAAAERRLSLADAVQRAFHLRAAGRHADLLRVLRPLIVALLRRGQPQRVYVFARWGLDALGALPTTRTRNRWRIEFLEAAADAADRLGARSEQRRWLDELSDLEFDPAVDPDALSRVYMLHGRYAASTGQYGLARGMYKNAVELAQKSGAIERESEALRRLGAVQAHVGELEHARELLERARDIAAHDPQRAVTLVQLGIVELLENRLESALKCVDRALRIQRRARRYQLPGITAAAHMLRGRIYRIFGRPARALGSMERAIALARQAGERRLEMEATARLGGLLLDLNRPEDAEARLREALLIAGEIEDRRGQTLAGLWLGTLLWEQADPTAAQVLDRASRQASEMGLQRAEALALSIRARVAREAGELDRALELTARAEGLIEKQGAELFDRIVVTGTRALVLHTTGDVEGASELVKALRRRMKSNNESIEDDALRRTHSNAMAQLLDAVLSPTGVIYPRVTDDAAPSEIG